MGRDHIGATYVEHGQRNDLPTVGNWMIAYVVNHDIFRHHRLPPGSGS